MKRLAAVFFLCMILSTPAWGQTDSAEKEKQKTLEQGTMPSQMGQGKMSGQMMQEMMPMMQPTAPPKQEGEKKQQ